MQWSRYEKKKNMFTNRCLFTNRFLELQGVFLEFQGVFLELQGVFGTPGGVLWNS